MLKKERLIILPSIVSMISFQLCHADVRNLEFLGKNATFPQYVLVLIDLFSSKVYTYPMRYRKKLDKG